MLSAQRRALILDEVRRRGAVRVVDLAVSLQVSDMTIRRDLEVLAEDGLLTKVHGGATAAVTSGSSVEPPFSAKAARQVTAKEAIADEAARLVEPGAAIAITAGTTTHAFARRLLAVPGLIVVTNSMPVSDVLHGDRAVDRTVILTGGIRTPSDALVGPMAVDAIERLHIDIVFMGTYGIDESAGFTSPNLLEAETNRAFVASGRRLVVLADSSKWGIVGLSAVAALHQADTLITDDRMPDAGLSAISDRIPTVIAVGMRGDADVTA